MSPSGPRKSSCRWSTSRSSPRSSCRGSITDTHGRRLAPWVSILGDVVILLSFLFIFWVTQVNSFAASNIRVEKDQTVIDTGPYAHVRHPMYAGASAVGRRRRPYSQREDSTESDHRGCCWRDWDGA